LGLSRACLHKGQLSHLFAMKSWNDMPGLCYFREGKASAGSQEAGKKA
jgi:hypothetical protein